MNIQQTLTLALPFIAAIVSYGLQQAHWDTRINTSIAGASVLLAAFVSLLLQGNLSGNVFVDTMAVVAVAVALQAGPFLPLQKYLVANFPVSSKAQQPAPVIPVPAQQPEPAPIQPPTPPAPAA